MKKNAKKLVLSKETVMRLAAQAHVAGGFTNTGCSGEVSATCGWTCGGHSNVVACKEPPTTL